MIKSIFLLLLFCIGISNMNAQFFKNATYECAFAPYSFQTGIKGSDPVRAHGIELEASAKSGKWFLCVNLFSPYGRFADSGHNEFPKEFVKAMKPPILTRYSIFFGYALLERVSDNVTSRVYFNSGGDYFNQSLGIGNWSYDSTSNGELISNYSREIISVHLGLLMERERSKEGKLQSKHRLMLNGQLAVYAKIRSYYFDGTEQIYKNGTGYFKDRNLFGALIKYDYTRYLTNKTGIYGAINFQLYPNYVLPKGIFSNEESSQTAIFGLCIGLRFR